ncbi:AfsR/SARP family transcriptional regulator [Streptomyces sp. ISL-43]|uniref:AfsR/SARP family transcriptional regulator n=1 Tax=Streptomyces sp. ISL-43 TaxID=2819183 RepID=UPI001BE591C0|nr:BTAD domain-containing putative transcriptional regulator [Streptomyces sp. ISL-43]MBT2448639.1 AfsR/SARP family transcriptional regulator [Streptomyces sp. ISL-43]
MEFRLLGGVCAVAGSSELPLGPAKRRSVLAVLLLRANSAVPIEQLIDALWDEDPPAHARTVIQGHVSRLRALLPEAGDSGVRLVTQGPSYVFEMPKELLDAHRFDELARLAKQQKRPAEAVATLREALALWRGPALTGTVRSASLLAAAHALEETRLVVVEDLADAYGRLGDRAGATAVLQAEAVAHPLRESLAASLMLALYQAGRQSDALDWYHRTRGLLADELGIDPGPALRGAYEAILRGEPTVQPSPPDTLVRADRTGTALVRADPAATATADRAASESAQMSSGPRSSTDGPVPRLLPRGVRGFLGRETELLEIDRSVRDGAIALVIGPAGVGKTALALQWAHSGQARYQDGTLFADLRGFGGAQVEPVEIVREFLLALGVPARRMPESAAAAFALYRTLTEERELLVVLDNARKADQVRSLLPAGPSSAVLVTSRLRLGGLIVEELARPVQVDVLGPKSATELLAAAVGGGRVAAEPAAAAQLARLCDGLPLALRITAAQLAARPRWRLADLASELANEQRRLALLSLDDCEDAGVAAALRLTVQGLPHDALRLFAQLGVLPGPDLDRDAAAALLDRSPAVAAEALDRLAGAHLITEYAPGRYSLHDLVRLYARGLRADEGALLRLLDSYTVAALAASAAAEPDDKPCCTLPADFHAPSAVREFESRDAAFDWYAAQRDNLAAAVAAARAAGHDDRAWRLAVLQWPHVVWHVRDGWVPMLEQALEATRRLDDPDAESRVRALLGWVLTREGRLAEALVELELAPALAARAQDPSSEATALVNLAVALDRDGVTDVSLRHVSRAVELAREAQDIFTELLALSHRTRQLLVRGDAVAAERCTAYALTLGGAGAPTGLIAMRHTLLRLGRGEALSALGEREAAEAVVRRALADAVRQGFKEAVTSARSQLGALTTLTADGGVVRQRSSA